VEYGTGRYDPGRIWRRAAREVHSLRRRKQASTIPSKVLSETRVRQLLEPFGLDLHSHQISQVLAYLDLLLRWNQKINLTGIRDPEECLTRHFGETLFLAKQAELHGSLLDIGSGAGFPGLALKIAFPALPVTLLEPVAKKRAFLKEAARVCGFDKVEARRERLEEFVRSMPQPSFDSATSRAVGNLERLVPLAARCLKPGGGIFLWLTSEQAAGLRGIECGLTWKEPLPIPLSRSGVILPGERSGGLAPPSQMAG
jgi:16S rRNA (guanine527-N7)-methyltransferase